MTEKQIKIDAVTQQETQPSSHTLLREIYIVDKPSGITSFDVIRRMRRKLGVKKMGHAGTLDPLASGLMIVGVGAGTKQLTHFIKQDKTYEVECVFGLVTDSWDSEGKVESDNRKKVCNEWRDIVTEKEGQIRNVLMSFVGAKEFDVPQYSAIKKDGKQLYKYARAGEVVAMPKREMKVYDITEISIFETNNEVCCRFACDVGSGTYVRSLVHELGAALNEGATLTALRRTKVAQYTLSDCNLDI